MIRLATIEDYDIISTIYQYARAKMKNINNPHQWKDSWPSSKMTKEDILNNHLYVICENKKIIGVFAFIIGEEENYKIIENGKWLDDSIYGTIHRIASSGIRKGIFEETLNFCLQKINSIRIDTHQDNSIMIHLLEKHRFIRCGTIYVGDGTQRIAYQLLI